MTSPIIVSGEAPETDSEDDIDDKHSLENISSQGAVIVGEDTESETEDHKHVKTKLPSPEQTMGEEKRGHNSTYTGETLLHKKLRETNNQLHLNLNSFCHNNINLAVKSLSSVDSDLLRSQVTLQAVNTSLESLNTNCALIKNKLKFIVDSNFIANIKTNSN